MGKLLNLEYGSIHCTYWMLYGPLSSFAAAFLLARGSSNSEIGMVIALASVLAIFVQPLLADTADRSARFTVERIMMLIGGIIALLAFSLTLMPGKSFLLLAVYVVLITLHTSIQPFTNALNFRLEECGVHMNYGLCRSGGSLGYSVLVALLGSLVIRYGTELIPKVSVLIAILFILSVMLTMRTFRRLSVSAAKSSAREDDYEEIDLIDFVKRNRWFVVMSIGVFFLFIHNQMLNNFMLQLVENVGGDSADMGRILSLMAFLEIPTMLLFDRINRRFSLSFLIKFAAVGFALKITGVFLAGSVGQIFASQFLQLISFGLFLPAIVKYIDSIMSKGEAVKGQALYTTMTTASAVLGSLTSGFILDLAGAKMLTLFGAVTAFIGMIIVILTVDRAARTDRKKKENQDG